MFDVRRSGSYIAAKHKATVSSLMKASLWLRSADRIYPKQKIVVR